MFTGSQYMNHGIKWGYSGWMGALLSFYIDHLVALCDRESVVYVCDL